MKSPTLFLVPNFLGDSSVDYSFPPENLQLAAGIELWIVESQKMAYPSLRKLLPKADLDRLSLHELNEHTSQTELFHLIKLLDRKQNIGLLSDAGMPAVADPGSEFVRIAHRKNWNIQPLIGPCSILQALVASGLNGQAFAFHGYLSRQEHELRKQIKNLQKRSLQDHAAQLFMETPFRNNKLIEELLQNLGQETDLCIAANIATKKEEIKTQSVAEWQKSTWDYHKVPCIFVLQS